MPRYVRKFNESKKLFVSRDFLLKAYKNIFKRFCDGVRWDICDIVDMQKFCELNYELFDCTYYAILSFRVWSHVWFCCRFQCSKGMCQMCSKVSLEDLTGSRALQNVKIKEEELFSPFQHYEKPFGHIRLSVTTSNLWEHKELNSIFSLFKLYIDVMSRILVHHCDVFIIPILSSGLKASIEDGASYENRRDKITASVFWRVRELAKRLTI